LGTNSNQINNHDIKSESSNVIIITVYEGNVIHSRNSNVMNLHFMFLLGESLPRIEKNR